MTPAFGSCVWGCGRNDFNREHVIGNQVVKALNLTAPVQVHYGPLDGAEQETVQVVLRRRVCKTCNSGWMRKLDNAIMSFMRPAFTATGGSIDLPPGSQRTLGRWVVKVALLMELYLHDLSVTQPSTFPKPDYSLPDANFRYLYKKQQVPPHAEIWLGQLDPEAPRQPFSSLGGGVMMITNTENGLSRVDQGGYFSMFILGTVLFMVVDYDLDYPGSRARPLTPALDGLVKVGPSTAQRVTWPPPRSLTLSEVSQLAERTAPWAYEKESTGSRSTGAVVGSPRNTKG